MAGPVTVRVPAKVNLYLGVGAARPDGFHDLASVFQAVSLYDEVTAAPGPGLSVRVTGEGADQVPADGRNLAVRAARALARAADVQPAARLTIRKTIPVAGGMAGGSADAAAALVACDALWGTGLTRDQLAVLAGRLGSDVPFALQGGTALGTGRGEQLTPALARGSYHWVFALAETGLRTPEVYAELDRLRGQVPVLEARVPEELMSALRAGDPVALGQALGNDLEPAALRLRPHLRRTLEAGRELGALGALVSGSGPTCALLCGSEVQAVNLAAALAGAGVCRSTRVAHGPVPGARVVEPQTEGG